MNSTEAVIRNHLRAATIGVDAILEDYTEESVLVTHDATYRGPAEIRRFFTALFKSLPAARCTIELWRIDYNTERPHTSLEGLTPFAFANRPMTGHNPYGLQQ